MPYKDPKKQREASERWRKKYPERHNNRIQKYKEENPWVYVYMYAKQRCTNPNNTSYNLYGGRGIKFSITVDEVKELWFRDKAYLMDKPSIDRKENNGNYEVNNCRFIEIIENVKRQDRSKFYKPILQYDLNNIFIREWKSQTQASKELNIRQQDIGACLTNKQKTAKGFIWRFKYENQT